MNGGYVQASSIWFLLFDIIAVIHFLSLPCPNILDVLDVPGASQLGRQSAMCSIVPWRCQSGGV